MCCTSWVTFRIKFHFFIKLFIFFIVHQNWINTNVTRCLNSFNFTCIFGIKSKHSIFTTDFFSFFLCFFYLPFSKKSNISSHFSLQSTRWFVNNSNLSSLWMIIRVGMKLWISYHRCRLINWLLRCYWYSLPCKRITMSYSSSIIIKLITFIFWFRGNLIITTVWNVNCSSGYRNCRDASIKILYA